MNLPEDVRLAAATIGRDIREAMDVIYGEIGGMDDTPEDVASAEKAIADDIRRVLDYIDTLDFQVNDKVEWNSVGDNWIAATVVERRPHDGPDGRISPLMQIRVDDNEQTLNVDRRHVRALSS